MWFRFPDGTEQISVRQQIFEPEVVNKSGKFFRAPDHFAPMILDVPGFKSTIPETDLPDLPEDKEETDEAIANLSARVDSLTDENILLKELVKVTSENLKTEQQKTRELEEEIDNLKNPKPVVVNPAQNSAPLVKK